MLISDHRKFLLLAKLLWISGNLMIFCFWPLFSGFTSRTALVIYSLLIVDQHCFVPNVIMTFKLLACSFITFYPFNDYNCLSRWYIDIGRAPTGCVLFHCVTLSVNRQQKSLFDLVMKQEFSHSAMKANRLSFCTVCGPWVQSAHWFVR